MCARGYRDVRFFGPTEGQPGPRRARTTSYISWMPTLQKSASIRSYWGGSTEPSNQRMCRSRQRRPSSPTFSSRRARSRGPLRTGSRRKRQIWRFRSGICYSTSRYRGGRLRMGIYAHARFAMYGERLTKSRRISRYRIHISTKAPSATPHYNSKK
jgi:hypothetical protein